MNTRPETYVRFQVISQEINSETNQPEQVRSTGVLPEDRAKKAIEKATKEGKQAEMLVIQSITLHEAASPEEFEVLVPDPEERVNIFNRGYVIKQQQIAREEIDDDSFEPKEGAWDLRELAAQKRERRKATVEDKLAKLLGELTPQRRAEILSQFAMQSAGTEAGDAGDASQPQEAVTA